MARVYKKHSGVVIPERKTCAVCGRTFRLWEDGAPPPPERYAALPFGIVRRSHYYKRMPDGSLQKYPGGMQLRSRCKDCHRDAERARAQRKREREARESKTES